MASIQKLLKRLLTLFKKEEPKKPEKQVETPVITYTDEQLELFNMLEPGDLVFADMPMRKSERNKIEEGHRSRPYLVLRKGEDYIHAYYCSSVSDKKDNTYSYRLLQSKYDFHKHGEDGNIIETDCYVYFKELAKLDIVHLQFFMTKIDDYDLQQINKKILIATGKRSRLFDVETLPCKGEVYLYKKNLYYVWGIKEKTLDCFPIHETDMANKKKVLINGKPYYVDTRNKKEIETSKCRLVSLSDSSANLKIERNLSSASESAKYARKAEKKKKRNAYQCKYEIGGLYHEFKSDREVVYLYTQNGKHYGFDLKASDDFDYIRIIQINPDNNKTMIRKTDDDFMCEVILDLMEQNHKLYDYFDAYYHFEKEEDDGNRIVAKNTEEGRETTCLS